MAVRQLVAAREEKGGAANQERGASLFASDVRRQTLKKNRAPRGGRRPKPHYAGVKLTPQAQQRNGVAEQFVERVQHRVQRAEYRVQHVIQQATADIQQGAGARVEDLEIQQAVFFLADTQCQQRAGQQAEIDHAAVAEQAKLINQFVEHRHL